MELIGIFLLGWGGGLLVNYLADVLPGFRKFATPVCLACEAKFEWGDYLTFRNCRGCGARRPVRAWIIQFLLPAAALWLYWRPPGRLGFILGLVVFVYFALIAVIDLEHKAILFSTSVFGAAGGVLVGSYIHGILTAVLGGLAGAGAMYLLYQFGILFIKVLEKIRKTEIDEVALGLGDVYLMGVLGLMMGFPEVFGGMIISLLLGGLISGLLILFSTIFRKYQPLTAIPYAPFLLLGALIMIYIPGPIQ